MSRVLVTGATGFVGRHLCNLLATRGLDVIGACRLAPAVDSNSAYALKPIGDIGADVEWSPLLRDVDCVVHLAARVHVMKESHHDPLAEFRRVNVEGTRRLLGSDKIESLTRFIYVSTVKIHGDQSSGVPIRIDDRPRSLGPYAQSKLEAEQVVEEAASKVGFDYTIVRPPLVYGPGVGGNFNRLMQLVRRGIPLPLAGIDNARSLVGIDNLCDLLHRCIVNSDASGKKYFVSDNSDISTPDLIRAIAHAMGRPARLFRLGSPVLRAVAKAFGRSAEISRLIDSLQVDITPTIRDLDWEPPMSLDAGIRSTVAWFQEQG